jgi:hypothetical protein
MGMIYTVPVKNIAARLNGDNIPAIVKPNEGGAAVVVNLENGERVSAICSPNSWGGSSGRLEICGGVTESEGIISDVFGGLTEEDVYNRFKYCYENNTRVYHKD